jgi:small subunit ribosomal protein S6
VAKPAPEYELVLMLDPEAPDERRDEIAVGARKRIEEGAELKQERSWGTRKMAYEINQRNEADYRFFRFAEGSKVLDDLNHNLKITDGVLRFRIYKVDPRAPVIDPPPPFSLAGADGDRPRGRRDERGGYDDRPPRAPEAETYDAPEATEAPAAEAGESPAPEAAEAAPAEAVPAAEAPAEAPAEAEAAPEAPADEAPAPAEPSDS